MVINVIVSHKRNVMSLLILRSSPSAWLWEWCDEFGILWLLELRYGMVGRRDKPEKIISYPKMEHFCVIIEVAKQYLLRYFRFTNTKIMGPRVGSSLCSTGLRHTSNSYVILPQKHSNFFLTCTTDTNDVVSPCSFPVNFLISTITQLRKCDGRLFDRYPKKGTKNLLTISGSDTSGAGIQVCLFTGPASSDPPLTVMSGKKGRSKNIRCSWMLWCFRNNCFNCSEYNRYTRRNYSSVYPRVCGESSA